MERTDQIATLRTQIDAIDVRLMELLANRFQLCLHIGELKELASMPVMQPSRVAEVTQRAAREARRLGVSPEFAETLWNSIILEACRLEDMRKYELGARDANAD
jgi:4-amino-4-deoxychorismate mutase